MCQAIELWGTKYYRHTDEFSYLFKLISSKICTLVPKQSSSLPGFYFTCDGNLCDALDILKQDCTITVNLKLCGGKGGFGTMLKTMGSRMGRSTNQDSCRTLEGRRLKDVKNDRRISEWKAQNSNKVEENKEEIKINRLKKIIEGEDPQNIVTNQKLTESYFKSIEKSSESVVDAVSSVLAGAQKRKEPVNESDASNRKVVRNSKLMWGMEDISSSGSDSENSENSGTHMANDTVLQQGNDHIKISLDDTACNRIPVSNMIISGEESSASPICRTVCGESLHIRELENGESLQCHFNDSEDSENETNENIIEISSTEASKD
ncbi:Protein SDE2 [Thelohanellus kitauei]|uniref:Protein SDE2 n=1 Tax=Thelohanellus kitauei TaxID=669202 RepID=A0A0C2JYM1_THEKT|nr:Protein SDE2 [Thelohanellus kitauei]